jgi:ribosome-associated toxin RatA of RatAB toxin-antitoxin module
MLLIALWLVAASETALPASSVPASALPDVAAGCVCCGPEVTPAHDLVPGEDWLRLRDGGVLKRRTGRVDAPGSLQGGAQASSLIAYPPEQVWAVLTDFESWPEFMPHLTASEVTRRDGRRQWVQQDFRIVMTGMRHTTIYELDPAHGKLSWELDLEREHDIAGSQGSWQLAPADDGRSTLVHYSSQLDSGRRVPAFVERMLFERSIDELFASLRAELARRAKARP